MNNYPKIAILLSTYNGEKFLSEQLDSLLKQTYSNLIIVVRDDDSQDGTNLILDDYSTRYKEKIHRIQGDKNNLGASGSFSYLVEYALRKKKRLDLTSAYLMFCDQDDIWFPEKVAIQVNEMLIAEKRIPTQPILIHSDLYVVSATNQLIAESFIKYQGLEIKRNDFADIIISNLVTGCTALINEELAKNAIPIPKKAIMHDWWLALLASATGEVIFLTTPLVHYRQHGLNTIGAKKFTKGSTKNRSLWQRLLTAKPNQHLREVAAQAQEFRKIHGSKLNLRENVSLLVSALMAVNMGPFQRVVYRIARAL